MTVRHFAASARMTACGLDRPVTRGVVLTAQDLNFRSPSCRVCQRSGAYITALLELQPPPPALKVVS